MGRKPTNIFLHFLNRDTQEVYGLSDEGSPYIHALFRKGINASVLLCDVETYCFLPLGFWFESRSTRKLLGASREFIEAGYLRFSAREESIQEFIGKKREQYYSFYKSSKGVYQDFFDESVLQQLLALNPILMDRRTKIGQFCSSLWKDAHNRLILDNSGDLLAVYSLITDLSDREKIAKIIIRAADDPESPFIWRKVQDLISDLAIRDVRIGKELRIYFEKNYYSVYLNEYDATNLYNFYCIDKGIDFHFGLSPDAIANYRWFETFLKYLNLGAILDAPAWQIVKLRQNPHWAILLHKYIDVCNEPRSFDLACGMLMSGSDSFALKESVAKVRETLNMKKEGLYLPIGSITTPAIDVLIMVATVEEERAITEHDEWKKERTSRGYEYFTREEGMHFALARAIDMGMESGATAAQYYISELNPRYLAMAGFCAGKQGTVNLGDVVVPDKVYQYGIGKQVSDTKVLPELQLLRLDYLWKQMVERFDDEWRNTISIPQPVSYESQLYLFFKMMVEQEFSVDIRDLKKDERLPNIAQIIEKHIKEGWSTLSGSNIIATEAGKEKYNHTFYLNYSGEYQDPELKVRVGVLATGQNVQQWDGIFHKLEEESDRKTCVLDMEGYAIADVAKFNRIPCMIAKGVGDFASGEKAFDNRYIPYSVFSAYRFLVAFFNELIDLESKTQ